MSRPPDMALVEETFQRYAAMPWERSTRRLGKELGINASTIRNWSARFNWVERVNAHDLQTKHAIFNRRQWRAEQRKVAKWGGDPRFWTQKDRDKWQRKLNAAFEIRARWGPSPLSQDLRAFMRAKSRHLKWECLKYGPEVVVERIGKPRGKPTTYLGSA